MGEKHSAKTVKEIIMEEVPDWEDEVLTRARFKAFSGQKSEWFPRYIFWRDLIITVARHLRLIGVCPAEVKNEWFLNDGITPLCLDDVFSLMYDEGYTVRNMDMLDPKSGWISLLFRRVKNLVGRPGLTEIQEKVSEAISCLSESHWTAHCVVSMNQFRSACGGAKETHAVLSFLVGSGRALYLSLKKGEVLEGVKVSLTEAPVASASTLDYDILHLVSTSEMLNTQIAAIEERHKSVRKSALHSLKSGDKKVALRYAKQLTVLSESSVKWSSLLSKVDGMLDAITDAATTKSVSDAIQMGVHAIKKSQVSMEDVEQFLEELEERMMAQKQLEHALESSSLLEDEDENTESMLSEIQSELDSESQESVGQQGEDRKLASAELTDLMSDSLSRLKLEEDGDKNALKSKKCAFELAQ